MKRGQFIAEAWYHAAQPNVHSGKLVSPCQTAWCRQRIPRSLEQWSTCCTCSYWGNRSSVEGAAGRARRARVVLRLHREIRSRRRCNKDMEQWQNKCDVFAMPCPPTNLLCTRPNSGAHRCWCVCAPHVYWEPVAPVARSTVSASVDTRSESQKIMYNKTEISTRGINRRAPFLKPIQGCATVGLHHLTARSGPISRAPNRRRRVAPIM